MRVTVYHNVSRDTFRGIQRGHPLVPVYAYEAALWPADGLARLWAALNIGDDPELNGGLPLADKLLAQAYRARKLRSLSVADVVRAGNRWFTVSPIGWREIDAAELAGLRVLEGAEAEAAVRELYQMRPAEELTVTVPLPDPWVPVDYDAEVYDGPQTQGGGDGTYAPNH